MFPNYLTISDDEVAFSSRFFSGGSTFEGIFTNRDGLISSVEAWMLSRPFIFTSGLALSDRTVVFNRITNSVSPRSSQTSYAIKASSNKTVTVVSSKLSRYVNSYSGVSIGPNPSISKNLVAFQVEFFSDLPDNPPSLDITGIYLVKIKGNNSPPVALVTTNDLIPASTGKFTNFGDPSISNGLVAFYGKGSNISGIYTKNITSPVSVIADTTTSIPYGSGTTFIDFGNPSLDGNKVAFRGCADRPIIYCGLQGIYTAEKRRLNRIADTSTLVPSGTGGNFTGFGDPSLSGNLIAFSGTDSSGGVGIYVSRKDMPLLKVIGTGNKIFGKTITAAPDGTPGLLFGRNGMNGNTLVFIAYFSDGSSGVYKAEIATTQAQCKNDGHKKFGFHNQGQCIQYVNTGK